eukprot:UN24641
MLSKNVQNFCILCHSKILRAVSYLAHLSNFQITTNTQISSKFQDSALAIFFCLFINTGTFVACDSSSTRAKIIEKWVSQTNRFVFSHRKIPSIEQSTNSTLPLYF